MKTRLIIKVAQRIADENNAPPPPSAGEDFLVNLACNYS